MFSFVSCNNSGFSLSVSSFFGQNKSVPANGRRAPPRRKDAELEVKLSAGAVKVAVVHKAIRGRGAGARANQKAAAMDSSQQETRRATMSATLSTSASSLGSELPEESIPHSSRNPARKQPDQRRTDGSPERPSSGGEPSQWAGWAAASDAAVGKARNPKRVRNHFSPAASAHTLLTLSSASTLSALVYAFVTSFVCTSAVCVLYIHTSQVRTVFQKCACNGRTKTMEVRLLT